MRKLLSALCLALFATATVAQNYPSPTFNNITVQGNVNLPSKPGSSVFMAPAAGGAPAFRTLDEVDLPSLTVAKITGLQAALDGKAASVHTHGAADINSGTLADARIPALAISKTTGLQAALDGKAAAVHTHAADDVISGTLADARIPSLAISKTTGLQAALDAKAPLASPALTGTPTAPTAANGTNTTQIATTAFVLANASSATPSNMVTTDTTQTITGSKSFSSGIYINGAAGTSRSVLFTTGGINRWITRAGGTAEGGSNSGSDYEISRRDDAGNHINYPFFIRRSDGFVNINGAANPEASLDVVGSTTVAGQANVAAKIGPNVTSDVLIGSVNGNSPFVASEGNFPLSLSTNGSARLTVAGGGDVTLAAGPGYADRDTSVPTTEFVQQQLNYINPRAYGAACNNVSDAGFDAAAAWAAAAGKGLQIDCAFILNVSKTVSVPLKFEPGGQIAIGTNTTITFANYIDAPIKTNVPIFGLQNMANSIANVSNVHPQTISACWWGACTGEADVADNIRSMFNSGVSYKNIVFPAGTYNLCSAIPVGTSPYVKTGAGSGQVGYPASNQSSVIIKQLTGFKVDAYSHGTPIFNTCAAIAQNIAVLIDGSTNFEWDGGQFNGSRSGLATTTVNAPFQLMNNQKFRIRRTNAASGYTDAGAFFEGDFNRDFVIEENIGAVGQCIDMAHSKDAVYRNNRCVGVSTDGNNIGIKAFSHINDGPLAGYNTSGAVAQNITVEGNRFENYISGIVIQNGTHWKVRDNFLIDIKGLGASPAAAVLINYVPSGSFSNVGAVPWNISIEGNHVDGLGTNVAGCGVSIGANAIANADVFNRIIINGNMFSGTAGSTAICSDTNSAAKVASFFVGINEYSVVGALMNANASSLAKPATLPR